jgi:hypothetical protein
MVEGQFLYAGAQDYVLQLIADGRLRAGRASEILNSHVSRLLYTRLLASTSPRLQEICVIGA